LDRFREPVGSQCKKLIAHSGPIYSTSFSPDNKYLVSVSEDKTSMHSLYFYIINKNSFVYNKYYLNIS